MSEIDEFGEDDNEEVTATTEEETTAEEQIAVEQETSEPASAEATDEPGDDWAAAMEEQDAVEVTADEEPGWDSALDEQQASTEDEQPAAAAAFESFDKNSNAMTTSSAQDDVNLDVILDVPVTISMEIGRSKISIRNLLQLNQGSVVELDRLAGEPMDVLVNGTLIAHGEVVVVNDKFGIRLTDVVSPIERVKKLKE